MKKQAYQDELTGVKNVTAYDMKVRGLNRRIGYYFLMCLSLLAAK